MIFSLICVITTKERVHDEPAEKNSEQKSDNGPGFWVTIKALLANKYWVMMFFANLVIFFIIIFNAVGGIYYCMYVFYDMGQYSWLSNSATIAQFAIMFVTAALMKKLGKEKMYIGGMILSAIGYLGFGLFAKSVPIMIVCNVFKGAGLGISGAMAMGIVADTLTYGNLKSGIDTVGMGNAGVSAAQKIGMGLGTAVFGWILSGAGFDGALDLQGLRQPESVTTAVQFVFTWIPLIMFAIISVILVLFFHLERDLKKMKEEKGVAED